MTASPLTLMTRNGRRKLAKYVLARHWRDVWRFNARGLTVETKGGEFIA